MKQVSFISAGLLLLLLGVVPTAYGRQDQHEQDSHAPQQQQAKPQERQTKPDQQKRSNPKAQQETSPAQAASSNTQRTVTSSTQEKPQLPKAQSEQANPPKPQQQKQSHQAQGEQLSAPKQEQAKSQPEHTGRARQPLASSRPPQRTEEAQTRQRAEPPLRLSAVSNSQIPDARFHSNFGRAHEFRIGSPRMVDGYSRFQYGGYWFGFVQPWPSDWYYTDEVYVDYIGGQYYLYNPYYPGVHIAISVVM
jgi:hypothetical protein